MSKSKTVCQKYHATWFLSLIAVPLALLVVCGCEAQASHGPDKVDELLNKMTLSQKIRLIHGERPNPATTQGQGGYMPGDAKLGIPWLRLADGPPGTLTRHRSTAPTGTMGLGATFSAEDARLNGVVIGRDARALGIDITLQPFINILRDPTWSRGYNLFGEDPLLVGGIGAAEIQGIQNQGVMAMAKHYLAYNGGNVVVGQQALHEIYAAPFADAVKAGVATIMCSYNRVNGAYSCGNPDTLQTLLKQEIGFKGFVTSDWGATHSSTFVNDGLDLEMSGYTADDKSCYFCAVPEAPPTPVSTNYGFKRSEPYAWPAPIPEEPPHYSYGSSSHHYDEHAEGMLAAVKDGQVNPANITAAARRILYEENRFGWLDKAPKHNITPVPFDQDMKVVEKTSEDAAVLLKNEDHALPLTPADLKSVALIGPNAGQTVTIGLSMEKALGFPSRDPGPLAALKQQSEGVPDRHIAYAVADDMTGTPIPASLLSHSGQAGLLREKDGQTVGVDPILDFTKKDGRALPTKSSFKWSGTLEIPKTGTYWIYLQVMGCAAQLGIDGTLIGQTQGLFQHGDFIQAEEDNVLPTTDNLDNVRRAVHLTKGSHTLVVLEEGDGSGRPVQVRLNWMTPAARAHDYQAALDAARKAKKVVVFAWARNQPDFDLPGDQDKLISDIAKINPNTIVVLNNCQPIALPWLNKVKAVVEMWYPGDGGGVAAASVLLGHTDPAGRMPFTWARQLDQYVSHDPAHPERSSNAPHQTTFSEGIFIGYRWFDKQNIQPLFPFGYGLSYTRFKYSDLHAAPASDGGLDVRFSIENVGKVYGDEVPQVYLGAPANPPAGAQFAVRALAGFDRIGIKPGESKQVTIHVPLRQLQYWSTATKGWQTATGSRTVYIGASSRDLRLHQQVTIPATQL